MEQFEHVVSVIALCMGASWASGINLYAAILVLGLSGMYGGVTLPPDLQILADPLVMGAAGIMYLVEFFADKIPGVDTGWDAVHTFIRIPAGALLAYGAAGEVSQPLALAAAMVGGGMAAGTHATKSGTRALINASPEPFSNWIASVSEDLLVFSGMWAALNHPLLFLLCLAAFVLLMVILLPRIWAGIKKIVGLIARLLGSGKKQEPRGKPGNQTLEERLQQLSQLLEKGLISEEEFERKRKDLLGGL